MLSLFEVKPRDVEDCIISSVVPPVFNSVRTGVRKVIGKSPMVVGPGLKTHKLGHPPGGHHSGEAAQLLLHPVQHPVQHGGGAVHDAAAHTVHSVFADDLFGLVQTDTGQVERSPLRPASPPTASRPPTSTGRRSRAC